MTAAGRSAATSASAGGTLLSGYLQLASSALLWGSIGVFVRMVSASSVTITFYRVLFGALSIFVLLALWRRPTGLRALTRRQVLHLTAVAFFYALNWVLFFAAIQRTTVGQAVLSYYTAPSFMVIFGRIFLGEKMSRTSITAVAVGFAGLALIYSDSVAGSGHTAGVLFGAAAGLMYAAAVTTARPLSQQIDRWTLACGQTAGATLLLLPIVPFFGAFPAGGLHDWGLLVVLGVVHTTVAFALFFSGLRQVPASRTGPVMYLDPVSSVVFAAIFLGEKADVKTLAGGLLVVVAGLMSTLDAADVITRWRQSATYRPKWARMSSPRRKRQRLLLPPEGCE